MDETTIINQGIDTIYIGYVVEETRKEFYTQLQDLKIMAQQENKHKEIYMKVGEDRKIIEMKIRQTGLGNYPYVLFNDNYLFKIFGYGKSGNRPNVYVEVRSEMLHRVGWRETIREIEKIIEEKIGKINRMRSAISRIDIYTDIIIDEDKFTSELKDRIRSRSNKRNWVENKGQLETLYIGEKGAIIQCRIYDKGKEREKQGKLKEYLERSNLEEIKKGDKIIRVEFQVLRKTLNEFKLKGLDKLPGSVTILWEYLTKKWMKVVHESKKNKARDEIIEAWWEKISQSMGSKEYIKPDRTVTKKYNINILGKLKAINNAIEDFAAAMFIYTRNNEISFQVMFDQWAVHSQLIGYDETVYKENVIQRMCTLADQLREGKEKAVDKKRKKGLK